MPKCNRDYVTKFSVADVLGVMPNRVLITGKGILQGWEKKEDRQTSFVTESCGRAEGRTQRDSDRFSLLATFAVA